VSAVWSALTAAPVEEPPPGFVPEAARAEILAGVLSGIELGSWDRRVAEWLTGLDTATLLTVASWVARARAAGPGR
jgi:hypothetical protein